MAVWEPVVKHSHSNRKSLLEKWRFIAGKTIEQNGRWIPESQGLFIPIRFPSNVPSNQHGHSHGVQLEQVSRPKIHFRYFESNFQVSGNFMARLLFCPGIGFRENSLGRSVYLSLPIPRNNSLIFCRFPETNWSSQWRILSSKSLSLLVQSISSPIFLFQSIDSMGWLAQKWRTRVTHSGTFRIGILYDDKHHWVLSGWITIHYLRLMIPLIPTHHHDPSFQWHHDVRSL